MLTTFNPLTLQFHFDEIFRIDVWSPDASNHRVEYKTHLYVEAHDSQPSCKASCKSLHLASTEAELLLLLFFSSQQWNFYYVLRRSFCSKIASSKTKKILPGLTYSFHICAVGMEEEKFYMLLRRINFPSFFFLPFKWTFCERELLCCSASIVNSFVFVMREGLRIRARMYLYIGKLFFRKLNLFWSTFSWRTFYLRWQESQRCDVNMFTAFETKDGEDALLTLQTHMKNRFKDDS